MQKGYLAGPVGAMPPALYLKMSNRRIYFITGTRQAGKSTVCRSLIARLRAAGVMVSGLLTTHSGPHDMDVEELHTGVSYSLTLPYIGATGPLPRFTLDPAAFERSCRSLKRSFPTDVFFLDELGPLELQHRQGWTCALRCLARESWRVACIVVRPDLLESAICELPAIAYTVVRVTLETRETLPDSLYREISVDHGVEQD